MINLEVLCIVGREVCTCGVQLNPKSIGCKRTAAFWSGIRRSQLPNYTVLTTYHGHSASVWHVAWSPEGTRIASAGADNTVQVWQIE